jgi:hypothetical protein
MAPKAGAKSPKPAAAKAAPAKGKTPEKEVDAPSNEPSVPHTATAAPKNKEEVLAQVNLDGLPHCPNDQILEILREKYETLVAVFIHYCKQSECKTLEQATRLRLGAYHHACPRRRGGLTLLPIACRAPSDVPLYRCSCSDASASASSCVCVH